MVQSTRKGDHGFFFKNKVVVKETPMPGEQVVPLTEFFKFKLNQHGRIYELKARFCFRGDLYLPNASLDPYSPHDDWIYLRIFLLVLSYIPRPS